MLIIQNIQKCGFQKDSVSQVSVTTTLYAIYLSNYLAVMPAEVKTHLLEQANLNSLAKALTVDRLVL